MTVQHFRNNATATLATSLTQSATQIFLQSGFGGLFPSPSGGDFFKGTLVDAAGHVEIVRVTARSGDTLTAQRAQEGTVARSWEAGSFFELRATAEALQQSTKATPNTLARRDSGGRMKAAPPVEPDDVALKATVDEAIAALTGDVGGIGGTLEGATHLPTPNTIVKRDNGGRFQAGDPVGPQDVVTLRSIGSAFRIPTLVRLTQNPGTNQNWTVPEGITRLRVTRSGGGGGGGGAGGQDSGHRGTRGGPGQSTLFGTLPEVPGGVGGMAGGDSEPGASVAILDGLGSGASGGLGAKGARSTQRGEGGSGTPGGLRTDVLVVQPGQVISYRIGTGGPGGISHSANNSHPGSRGAHGFIEIEY